MIRMYSLFSLLLLPMFLAGQVMVEFSTGSNCDEPFLYNAERIFFIDNTGVNQIRLVLEGTRPITACENFDTIAEDLKKRFVKITDSRTRNERLINSSLIVTITEHNVTGVQVVHKNLDGGEERVPAAETYANLVAQLQYDANDADQLKQYKRDIFTSTGAQSSFTLSQTPIAAEGVHVLVNGKDEVVNISLVGNTITHRYRNFPPGVVEAKYYYK